MHVNVSCVEPMKTVHDAAMLNPPILFDECVYSSNDAM